MEVLEPVQGVGDQEVAHLMAAVIEDERPPVGMGAAAGVGMLVHRGAVEVRQGPLVAGEVCRHPVENDADAARMEDVDELAEVVGRPEAGGRRVVPRHLVAPRPTEGVLGDGQQLDVGEAQPGCVIGQRVRRLAVGQGPEGPVDGVEDEHDAPPRHRPA